MFGTNNVKESTTFYDSFFDKLGIIKVEIEKDLMSRENSISYRLATVFGMSPRMRIFIYLKEHPDNSREIGHEPTPPSHLTRLRSDLQ